MIFFIIIQIYESSSNESFLNINNITRLSTPVPLLHVAEYAAMCLYPSSIQIFRLKSNRTMQPNSTSCTKSLRERPKGGSPSMYTSLNAGVIIWQLSHRGKQGSWDEQSTAQDDLSLPLYVLRLYAHLSRLNIEALGPKTGLLSTSGWCSLKIRKRRRRRDCNFHRTCSMMSSRALTIWNKSLWPLPNGVQTSCRAYRC